MKYKIFKTIKRELNIHDNKDGHRISELVAKEKYYAKRKGRIFGFWHTVGTQNCDYQGNTYLTTEYFCHKSDCKEFIKWFHYWKYGIGVDFEII